MIAFIYVVSKKSQNIIIANIVPNISESRMLSMLAKYMNNTGIPTTTTKFIKNLRINNISRNTNFIVVHRFVRASEPLRLIASVTLLHSTIILYLLYGRRIATTSIQNPHIPNNICMKILSTILSINILITNMMYVVTENDDDKALYSNIGKNALVPLPKADHILCLLSLI